MAGEFLIESAEDMEKELSFDKFMDEILTTESSNKTEEEDINEHRVRKLMRECTNRPADRTRFVRK